MLELLVQTKTGTSNLASTVVTFDNNTVAGNSIIVISGNSSSTAGDVSGVTDTQGNLYVKDNATANATVGEIEIWHTSGIIGGANTVTVAYTTGVACAVIIREYYGLVYSNSLDKQVGTTGNSASLNSGNTTALTQNNELLIGAGLIPLANSFSAGGNFVNLVSAGAPLVVAVAAEDLFVTTGGAQAAAFGANASIQWVCVVATYFLSATGTTTSTSSTSASTFSTSSTSSSISSTSSSISTTSNSTSTSSTSVSMSITTMSTSSTSSSISSTSISSTSSSTSISSTSTSISSTSLSSTSQSSTSSSSSISSTSTSFSSTSSSISSTSSSVSSTSFSSTSSSSSTSTTTLPPPFLTYSYQDQAPFTTVRQFTQTGTWVCPPSVTSVVAQCWGAGGGGGGCATVNGEGLGGGGGGYGLKTLTVTPGTSYTVTVGAGGAGGSTGGTNGVTGGDTWFSTSTTVKGTGGVGGTGNLAPSATAAGPAGGVGTGDVTYSGGNGGGTQSSSIAAGGGGGGGAGSLGSGVAGIDAISSTAGTGGKGGGGNYGGTGGTGGGSAIGNPGKPLGAGGGGAGSSPFTGGDAAGGMVQLTYTTGAPSTTSTNLSSTFNAVQYGNVSTDDGDYFIERGTQYLIREYKKTWTNNTDNPAMAWKGRSTISSLRSPILIQIYNVNSATWETLARQTLVPADTDFQVNVSQTTNVSNYYDSTNTVTFRSYQQVI